MPRYVPKTYNNRRVLRIILGTVTTIALSVVILFLILFFLFQGYVVDGRLEIPWLDEEMPPTATPPPTSPAEPAEPEEETGTEPEAETGAQPEAEE